MNEKQKAYDRSVKSLKNADGYDLSGQSEYSRERSDPYTMVDFMIDRGVDFTGFGPKGFYPSDERTREEVCEVLTRDPRIDASEIDVFVSEGVVLLKGRVDSRQIKRLAEMTIENLHGVRDIINQLSFSPYV